MPKTLRLGTRRSLLALAQSGTIARALETLETELRVELVGIETRGDKIQDIPLQRAEGKDFFVAELDEALLRGDVDLTVHSMKDLSLERPAGIAPACIPARENPRDVVVFGSGVTRKLTQGQKLRIGTSSPRRIENIPPLLRRVLPRLGTPGGPADVQAVEIRGNVNTRLARLREPESSDRHLDGVVLALAGLARLWLDGPGCQALSRLLRGTRTLVLPLTENPAAPAQGALAIECRANDTPTRALLARLHHEPTASVVARERAVLAHFGGGCHQRFGSTGVDHPHLGPLLHTKGIAPNGQALDSLEWLAPPPPAAGARAAWDGSDHRLGMRALAEEEPAPSSGTYFVANARALPAAWDAAWRRAQATGEGPRIWVSGTKSWEKLAARGLWVEGCGEGLGMESVRGQADVSVLRLPPWRAWRVLTHEGAAQQTTQVTEAGRTVDGPRPWATYGLEPAPREAPAGLREATHVFWASGSQFDALNTFVSANAHQACGPGKTADKLQGRGVHVFPSVEEWKKWLTTNS